MNKWIIAGILLAFGIVQAKQIENPDAKTLWMEDGREIEFIEGAIVPLGGRVYAILQPVELLEGMEEGEALVFEMMIGEDGPEGFNVVLDDEKIDAVFAVYNEMCDDGMPYENN